MTTSSLINSVAETTSHRDRDELDHAIARLLLRFLNARSVTLLRLLDDGQVRRVVRRVAVSREHGELGPESVDEPTKLPPLAGVAAWQECVVRNDVVQGAGGDGHVVTLVPIRGGREVVGILAIDAEALASRDTDLIHGVLRIVENHIALLDYGERDTLTGLLNRKTFESHFDRLRQRLGDAQASATAQEPSWLALMDIDRFKSINDSHGHLFGDEVLLLVSQLMKRNFRGADQLFRFGGEEFLIVLDHASEAGAYVALERFRGVIEAHGFPQIGRVSISIGYTRIDLLDGPTTCVERADGALYYAKSHGRNKVCNYEALLAAGELVVKCGGTDVELF